MAVLVVALLEGVLLEPSRGVLPHLPRVIMEEALTAITPVVVVVERVLLAATLPLQSVVLVALAQQAQLLAPL
jgi:hypothetical protein